jgi:hypothetical protein
VTKLLQALCLLSSLVALGVLTDPWVAVLAGGVIAAVLLELNDPRGE